MPKKIITEEKTVKTLPKTKSPNLKKAIIALGAKQYFVKEGETISVELLKDEKKNFTVKDLLSGSTVSLEIISEIKGEKLSIWKFKNKTRSLRRLGHRQKYNQVKILKIA